MKVCSPSTLSLIHIYRMLTELLDTDSGLLVSLHIRSMDQNEAIKTVKRKITDIDSMKIDAQKKAVREGFDLSLIHI